MAFAFRDSTVKLPPIRKESVEETNPRDGGIELASPVPYLHREKHGLVRLPPIVRLNSSKSDTRSSPNDDDARRMDGHISLNPDTLPAGHRKHEEASDLSPARFSSHFSPTVKHGDTGDQYEKQQLRPNANDIYQTTDVSRHEKHGIHIVEEITTELTPPCALRRPSLSTVQDSLSSSTTQQLQGSTFCEKPLRRARPFAKSSPELSERRHRAQQNPNTIRNTDTSVNSLRLGETASRRPSVYDINATLLLKPEEKNVDGQARLSTKPSKQNIPKVEGTAKQRTKRRNKDLALTKTHSNPASPVCNERPTSSKAHGRKSLTDIEWLGLPLNTRQSSLQPVKSQNLIKDDNAELTVKGKTCPRSERRPSRAISSNNDHLVPPPPATAKRDSLYDLRQILGILNQEGADQSLASASAQNASPSPVDGAGNMAASVYDLREFLTLALADAFQGDAERSSEKIPEITQPQAEGNSSSLLNANTTSRRVSAYDLMEFLTLGLSGKSPSQSSSRTSTPPAVSLPAEQQDSRLANLEVPGDDSSRRSSTYDLMEFLSLRATSSRPQTPPQGKQKSSQSPPVEAKSAQASLQENRKERSVSVYDLQEFLAMQTVTQPTASQENRKTVSTRQSRENLTVPGTENVSIRDETSKETLLVGPPTLSGTSVGEGQLIEGQRHENRQVSVYDLREFLKLYSFSRKPSSISQSGVTIYVTDEKAERAESEEDASPSVSQQDSVSEAAQRKPSTYDLTEFLSALEDDNSPLRRRMSSVSGASGDEHRPSISGRTDSGSSNFLCVNPSRASFSDASRSRLVARQDSIGNRSLYDLHEFLTLLNSEDALTGRRLSNMTVVSPTSPSRQDAEKFVFDIEEHPRNDTNSDLTKTESQRPVEKGTREMLKDDISIEVPTFLIPKAASEKTIADRFSIKNRLAALKSVPEATDN